MKKIIYTLSVIAASVCALTSCQKEQDIQNELASNKKVTLSFIAEKAGIETRTAADEGKTSVSYIWTDEDIANFKLFSVTKNDKDEEVLSVIPKPTVKKNSETELTISAKVDANATYTFRAVLSGDWTNNSNKPRVKATQVPNGTENFDPTADILISDDQIVEVGEEAEGEAMLLTFRRQIVVNKMTLKNLKEGEVVSKVVITSDKNLTGYINTADKAFTGDGKIVTLNYEKGNVVPKNGQFPVYFTSLAAVGQRLTVEVTTDQFIYTKSFDEGKTIDFKLGQFTKFNVAMPEGIANTALSLPLEDSMAWANNGSDASTALNNAQLNNLAKQGDKSIYGESNNAYLGAVGLKLGSSRGSGSITTNNINLSTEYNISIDARTYNANPSSIVIYVDGDEVLNSALSAEYATYFVNCSAATNSSKIKIAIEGSDKRGYIQNFVVKSGKYIAPPIINITSENPIEVANTASSQTINYYIENETESTLTATTDAEWISNLNYSISGQVTFDVAAQEAGAVARSADIILNYEGAKSQVVTVNQVAGDGGAITYSYLFTANNWKATLNGEKADWISGKDGYGYANSGIQVTKNATGANGTSPVSFTDIEEIVITYCTNKSDGVGAIEVTVGNGEPKTYNVTKPSSDGTTPKTYSFSYSPKETGKVKIEVTCTTNSIYLIGAAITATGIAD